MGYELNMTDEIYICECGFKCVAQQLNKSKGLCPKCNKPKVKY